MSATRQTGPAGIALVILLLSSATATAAKQAQADGVVRPTDPIESNRAGIFIALISDVRNSQALPGRRETAREQRNMLILAAESATQSESALPSAPVKPPTAEAKEPAKQSVPPPPAAVPAAKSAPSGSSKALPAVDPAKAPETKSQSIMEMLEGRETEVKLGLILAAIFFALGWLCGGAYIARRERKSRHKLRF